MLLCMDVILHDVNDVSEVENRNRLRACYRVWFTSVQVTTDHIKMAGSVDSQIKNCLEGILRSLIVFSLLACMFS